MAISRSIACVGCWLVSANLIFASGPLATADLPITGRQVVAFSPSGAQVAVGGLAPEQDTAPGGIVVLLDAAEGQQQFQLLQPSEIKDSDGLTSSYSINMVQGVAYSGDGKILAVAAQLGLKLWDSASGEELATLCGYGTGETQTREEIQSLALSPDGTKLATTGGENRLRLWDIANRKMIREFVTDYRLHLAFSPDGATLVTAGQNNQVTLLSSTDGKKLAEINARMGPLHGVATNREGTLVAAVGEGGEKLWRIGKDATGNWQFTHETRLRGHMMGPVRGVAFSPDGKLLATNSDYGAIMFYDVSSNKVVGALRIGGPFVFSPDGKTMAVAHRVSDPLTGRRIPMTRVFVWKVANLLDHERLAEQARTAAEEMTRTLVSTRPDREMIQTVLSILGGPESEKATPILADGLKNPLVNEKHLLLYPLGRVSQHDPQARAVIIEALEKGGEVDIRSMAARVLADLPGEQTKEAVPALEKAARDDVSPSVRTSALRALEKLDPAAHRIVMQQLRERGPVVDHVERHEGQFVYQGRPLEEWIQRLSVSFIPNEIFGRPSPNEPLAAIRAIGPDAVPILIETLKSGTAPLRQAAAAGLEALGSHAKSAIEPLLDTLGAATERTLHEAGSAADALAVIIKDEKQLPARLVELSNSEKPAVRLSAARALAVRDSGDPRGVPVLQAAFDATSSTTNSQSQMGFNSFGEGLKVDWLRRVLVAKEAPEVDRFQAATSLTKHGETALPALPELIQVVITEDNNIGSQAALAIQAIGPKATTAVSEALKTTDDAQSRQRLSVVLWNLGEEGQKLLNETLTAEQLEAVWWSAASFKWDYTGSQQYQWAAREGLIRAGRMTDAQQPNNRVPMPDTSRFQPRSIPWMAKLVADRETPKSIRLESVYSLVRAPTDEIQPLLPALLTCMVEEQDRDIISQLANIIQRVGPKGVPAVKAAIGQARTDIARRELLRALSSLGEEGQREFSRLMLVNPEYGRLFRETSKNGTKRQDKGDRELTPLEKKSISEAAKTDRPLTNGDFNDGLNGWNIEGGAAAFRTHPRGDKHFLTTWGERQDGDTGRLFQCFRVPEDAKYLTFKLHGGSDGEKTYVALWKNNHRFGRYTARNDNTPFGSQVDIMPFRGEVMTLEIVDNNTDGWGFIGAEDFQIVGEK